MIRTNRRLFTAGLSSLALAGPAQVFAAAQSPALAAAVAGPQRSASNRARDRYRHPAESLSFWELRPGMTVIEIYPGGGYWSEILAPYAKATGGKYIATVGANPAAFQARFADKAVWGDIAYTPFGAKSGPLGPPNSADFVLTARNIHNWMWEPVMLDKALKDFFAVLKPGGVLAVEEHRAEPRPMVTDAKDGYVSTDYVLAQAEKAGFLLEASSEVNANPLDTKDHPFGVWTLPPDSQTSEEGKPTPPGFNAAKYLAIGESDRMTMRFRKPT
jgi:predicted methyltransferase